MNDRNDVRHSLTNQTAPSWATPDNPYAYGGQPGPYTPPPTPPAPRKRMPRWAKVLLAVFAAPVVFIGGCTAIVAGSGAAQEAAEHAQATSPTYDPGINTPLPQNTHKPGPGATKGEQQALRSAESYLRVSAFSRAGLIRQLSSEYGENFSVAEATYAADHVKVDWNAQAARAAASYLKVSAFSRAGMVRQLESEYGDGFTHAQAVYGAKAAGL